MTGPIRVTGSLLDVLEIFVQAVDSDADDLHGWAIIKAVRRSGPTVYGVLDRLEDIGWITGYWENSHPEPGTPRHRFYRLTPTGVSAAREVLQERRPHAARPLRQVSPPLLPSWLCVLWHGGAP